MFSLLQLDRSRLHQHSFSGQCFWVVLRSLYVDKYVLLHELDGGDGSFLPPLTCISHRTLQQLTDDDIAPLCANLGRFKRLKAINLVSRGM